MFNPEMLAPIPYDIVDGRTGRVVGKAKTRAAASRSVDRRDNEWGGYRFRAVAVYPEAPKE